MLFAGSVRCVERAFSLYFASIDVRLDKVIPPLDSSTPNGNVIEDLDQAPPQNDKEDLILMHKLEKDPKKVLQNFMLLFIYLFKDLVSNDDDLLKDQLAFEKLDHQHAFQLVEVQLSYAFDLFYTKLSALSNNKIFFISISTSFIFSWVPICFMLFVTKKHEIQRIDRKLTWLLLIGSSILDYYSTSVILLFHKLVKKFVTWQRKILDSITPFVKRFRDDNVVDRLFNQGTWSRLIHQCNLLTFCLQHIHNSIVNFNKLQHLIDQRPCKPRDDLKKYIFDHLVRKSKLIRTGHHFNNYGVNDVIEERGLESILEWTKMLEFHQSILTWHIATDICYHHYGIGMEDDSQEGSMKISKIISEYMLYILVKQRHMLPVGAGLVSFRDTCYQTIKLLAQSNLKRLSSDSKMNVQEACEELLGLELEPDRSKSVISYACKLASSLINLEMESEVIWKMLNDVWVEILVYATTHCRVDQHAQHLRKGGEFLTHVWLLSAHLGVMDQFQVRPYVLMDHSSRGQAMNQGHTYERGLMVKDGVEEDINEGHEGDIEEGHVP